MTENHHEPVVEPAEEPIVLEIDGVLDLHPFSPKDLKTLIPDYIEECLKKGLMEIKIIHGKGIGNIRRSVHALLDRNSSVASYRQADLHAGSWGATIVILTVDLQDSSSSKTG